MNDKKAAIQVRVSPEEVKLAKQLADDYNVSISELVRLAILHIDRTRPTLTITLRPAGKALAPTLEMSRN